MSDLIEMKRAFFENHLPDLERDLAAFIAAHPILRDCTEVDKKHAAHNAAVHLLLSISFLSVLSVVGLER